MLSTEDDKIKVDMPSMGERMVDVGGGGDGQSNLPHYMAEREFV